jgi:DNA-binding transcriptional LysR family regulator
MLDLRRLRLLRELSIRGTLAAVAEALSYSQSAVSQQLSLLEAEAGVPLLQKAGRRVQLTPQAQVLVEHTTALLERLELAESELTASAGRIGGRIRLAVFQSAALAIVPRALTELATRHPELRVEVVQREPESALSAVWAREFDLVIAEQYPNHSAPRLVELDRQALSTDALRLGVPSGSGIRSLADASAHAWVMEPRGTASRHWSEQACRQAGFEPDVRYETADLMAHIRLIESGNAVAVLPDLVWSGTIPSVDLVSLPGDPQRTVFTAARVSSGSRPAIVACREALRRAVDVDAPASTARD